MNETAWIIRIGNRCRVCRYQTVIIAVGMWHVSDYNTDIATQSQNLNSFNTCQEDNEQDNHVMYTSTRTQLSNTPPTAIHVNNKGNANEGRFVYMHTSMHTGIHA